MNDALIEAMNEPNTGPAGRVRRCNSAFFTFLALCLSGGLYAQSIDYEDIEDNWLLLVSTNNLDPAQESAFNAWYDDIDIPDVLEVPGFERARRGKVVDVEGHPNVGAEFAAGGYVALYDIESVNIDRTIIAMLMASWGMEKADRSTDLLEVTERIYYRQYASTATPKRRQTAGGSNTYLYITRFDGPSAESNRKALDQWYEGVAMRAMLKAEGMRSATRYQRYWVLMNDPPEVPEFLTVFEIDAASPEAAMAEIAEAQEKISRSMLPMYVDKGSTLFSKIGDVASSRN